MEIIPNDKRDKIKAKIMEQMMQQWIKDNDGLFEDINKLSTEIVIFNTKWGAKLNLPDIYEHRPSPIQLRQQKERKGKGSR